MCIRTSTRVGYIGQYSEVGLHCHTLFILYSLLYIFCSVFLHIVMIIVYLLVGAAVLQMPFTCCGHECNTCCIKLSVSRCHYVVSVVLYAGWGEQCDLCAVFCNVSMFSASFVYVTRANEYSTSVARISFVSCASLTVSISTWC